MILKPQGTGLITTPNYTSKKPTWIGLGSLREFGVECDCEHGYFHTAYHPNEMAEMARKSGLEVIEQGTFEKEIKYAAKIPAAIFITLRAIARLLHWQKLEIFAEKFFQQSSLFCYRLVQLSGLEKCLTALVKNGARSYVVVKKMGG